MIEQAMFTYSPLGKAFKKQIKTIEDQGEKLITAIQNQGQVKTIKNILMMMKIAKQKEKFNKLLDEMLDEITNLDEKVNCDYLIYRYGGKTPDEKFNTYDNTLNLINKIKKGKLKLADVKEDQIKFKSNLGERKKRKN